jgi:hypothetical protein
MIIIQVSSRPKVLLLLPLLNRAFRDLFRENDNLWQRIFRCMICKGPRQGVSASHTQRIAPDIDLRIVDIPRDPRRNAQQIRRIISLRFLPTCSLCGQRRGHRPHWQLGLRICNACSRRLFVSNEVLLQCHGLGIQDLLRLLDRGAYTLPSTRRSSRRIAEYSDHPIDLAGSIDATSRTRRPLVFFWGPHIAQLLTGTPPAHARADEDGEASAYGFQLHSAAGPWACRGITDLAAAAAARAQLRTWAAAERDAPPVRGRGLRPRSAVMARLATALSAPPRPHQPNPAARRSSFAAADNPPPQCGPGVYGPGPIRLGLACARAPAALCCAGPGWPALGEGGAAWWWDGGAGGRQ